MPDFMQDLKLKLDPAFMPPMPAPGTLPPMVPPLRLGPPGTSPGLGAGMDPTGLSPSLLPPLAPGLGEAPMTDLFAGYADGPSSSSSSSAGSAMQAISGAVEGLGTRPGVQVDKRGIGTTIDDWKLRFMPYIPFLNGP
jgi:hypothetical protein